MPEVMIHATVPADDFRQVYRRLCDFEAYPAYTSAVREVKVVPLQAGAVEARWAVNFRNGVLCWIERDTFDDSTSTITFAQTDGDFDRFEGTWTVGPDGAATGAAISFRCSFDLGMPSLAAIVDPIACEALEHNIKLILAGLLGPDVAFSEPAAAGLTVGR